MRWLRKAYGLPVKKDFEKEGLVGMLQAEVCVLLTGTLQRSTMGTRGHLLQNFSHVHDVAQARMRMRCTRVTHHPLNGTLAWFL